MPKIKVIELEKQILGLNVEKELYKIPEKPHFLIGVNQVPEPSVEQYLELNKLYQSKDEFYGYNGRILIDKSAEKMGLEMRENPNYIQLTAEIQVAGKKVFVIFPYHLLNNLEEKEFIYMSPLGPKNLAEFSPKFYEKYKAQWAMGTISDQKWSEIKRVLGWAQFEAVKHFLFNQIEKAVKKDVNDYGTLTSKVLDNLKKILDDENLSEVLKNKVPGEEFTVDEILMVPKTDPSTFVPDTLIFGALPYAWGLANRKAIGTERFVFYDLLGACWDYIQGWPEILSHEFVHTNPYLQGMPDDLYFEVEMWTSLTTNFLVDIFYWSDWYLSIIRDTVHTYFGYDSDEARNRISPYRFVMLSDLDRKEFEENLRRVQEIQNALNEFIPEFLAIYYTDRYFWNAVNMKLCDKAGAWRMMMSFEFEPAIIFDSKKIDPETGEPIPASVQTSQWLAEQIAAGKIQKLMEEAMKKAGELTEFGKKMSKLEDYGDMMKCPGDSNYFHLPPERQKEIDIMLEQFLKENDPAFIRAMNHFMRLRGK